MLKRIIIGLTAVGLLAAPALAQRYDPDAGSGNIVQGPGGPPVTASTPPYVGQRSGRAYDYDQYTVHKVPHHVHKVPHHKHYKKRHTFYRND